MIVIGEIIDDYYPIAFFCMSHFLKDGYIKFKTIIL